jgi:hypothetical protein
MTSVQATISIECPNCHHAVEAEAQPVAAGEHTLEVKATCPKCGADCKVEVPPDQWLRASLKPSAPPPISQAQRSFLDMVRSVVAQGQDPLDGLPPLLAAAAAFEAWIGSLPEQRLRTYPALNQVAGTLRRNPTAGLLQTLPAALGLDPDAEWGSDEIEAARAALIVVSNNARPLEM